MSDMEPIRRKRSTSSESELSDGWSLLDSTDENNQSDYSCDTISSKILNNNVEAASNSANNDIISYENDSDADSVEVIREEHPDLMPALENRIIAYINGRDKNELFNTKEDAMTSFEHEICPKVSLIDNGWSFTRDWFQVVLVFSIIGLLVIVSSFVILFFQAQLISFKTFDEGSVYNSDSDMNLLAQITFYKKEIQQLKNELRSLNQEVTDWVRVDKEALNNAFESTNEEGLETITEKSHSVPLQDNQRQNIDKSLNDPDFQSHQIKIDQVVSLYGNISGIYSREISDSAIVLLNKVHDNVVNLLLLSDSVRTSDRLGDRSSVVSKIRKKLTNFFVKIEEDFEKVVTKMSKRSNKIRSDIVGKICTMPDAEGVLGSLECGHPKGNLKENKNERKTIFDKKKRSVKTEDRISEPLKKDNPADIKTNINIDQLSDINNNVKENKKLFSNNHFEKKNNLNNNKKSNQERNTSKTNNMKENKKDYKDNKMVDDKPSENKENNNLIDKSNNLKETPKIVDESIKFVRDKNKKNKKLPKEGNKGKEKNKSTMNVAEKNLFKSKKNGNSKILLGNGIDESNTVKENNKMNELNNFQDSGKIIDNVIDNDTDFEEVNSFPKMKFNFVKKKKVKKDEKLILKRETKGVPGDELLCAGKQEDPAGKKCAKLKKPNNKKKRFESPYPLGGGLEKMDKHPIRNGSVYKSQKAALGKNNSGRQSDGGLWFLEMGEVRARRRSDQQKSDWMFERHRARNLLRDEAKWVFDRASMREFCRTNTQSYWCI